MANYQWISCKMKSVYQKDVNTCTRSTALEPNPNSKMPRKFFPFYISMRALGGKKFKDIAAIRSMNEAGNSASCNVTSRF